LRRAVLRALTDLRSSRAREALIRRRSIETDDELIQALDEAIGAVLRPESIEPAWAPRAG
jgi:hypothetical protein